MDDRFGPESNSDVTDSIFVSCDKGVAQATPFFIGPLNAVSTDVFRHFVCNLLKFKRAYHGTCFAQWIPRLTSNQETKR